MFVIDTPIDGYVVGVIELRDPVPTGTPGEYEDWNCVLSAGGHGERDMLSNLYAEATAKYNEVWGSDAAREQAIEEIMELVQLDLRNMIDALVVASKQTA